MDILGSFSGKEKIGGLEISETSLNFVLLEKKGKSQIADTTVAVTLPLPEHTFENGSLKNPATLAEALKKLRKIIPSKLHYVIVSIPDPLVYTHNFSFPATLSPEKLNETVQLAVTFQLPIDSKTHTPIVTGNEKLWVYTRGSGMETIT